MRRRFRELFIGIIIIISLLAGSISFAENIITVQLDGKTLNFDVQPQLIGGRTMVPMRMIFESMGATVDWNNDTQTVTAYNKLYLVQATINSSNMKVNGVTKELDTPPLLVGGRTLVPARFIAEAFGAKVDWDGSTSIVSIWSKLKKVDYPMYPLHPKIPDFGVINDVPAGVSKDLYVYNLKDFKAGIRPDEIAAKYKSIMQDYGFIVDTRNNQNDDVSEGYTKGNIHVSVYFTEDGGFWDILIRYLD